MIDIIRDRATSICETQGFGATTTPFSFDLQPTGAIEQAHRIEIESGPVIGGFDYSEERTDRLVIWVTRKFNGEPKVAYARLANDVSSLRAAVIRDGDAGDYFVPDGAAWNITADRGREYAVARLSLPVNYMAQV